MTQVNCPSCQAQFEVDFAAGTRFTCGDCQALVTVPGAPVIRPITPGRKAEAAAPAASPPPVPAAPAAPKSPVEPPAAPVAGASARPKPGVRGSPAAPGAGRPRREAAPGARPGRTPARPAAKKPPVVLIAAGIGVVVLGVAAFVVFKGGGRGPGNGGPEDTGTPPIANPLAPANDLAKAPADPYQAAKARAEREGSATAWAEWAGLVSARADDAEKGGDAALAGGFRKDALLAWNNVLKRDPTHAIAREKIGDVLFDAAEARAFTEAAYIPGGLRDDILLAAEEILGAPLEGSTRKSWLSGSSRGAKEWAVLLAKARKLRQVEEDRNTDPFYADGDKMGRRLVAEFSDPAGRVDFHLEGVTGDAFAVFLRKPYVLLVQREAVGGEDKIAETWGDALEALQRTFYQKFGDKVGLPPMNKPTPVFILKNGDEYTKYLRRDDTGEQVATRVTSGAHFEPWSNRLVCYRQKPETDREIVFHEGTHQIVEFAIKTAGSYRGMTQSLWFSEGIADYFGGHGKEWDAEKREWRYLPGMINKERVAALVDGKIQNSLFSIEELLDYQRLHYQEDNKDPTKRVRTLNGYCQGWGLVYLLNDWKADKYREDFVRYVQEEFDGKSGKATFSRIFAKHGLEVIEEDFLDMIEELRIAQREGRIVDGRILPPK